MSVPLVGSHESAVFIPLTAGPLVILFHSKANKTENIIGSVSGTIRTRSVLTASFMLDYFPAKGAKSENWSEDSDSFYWMLSSINLKFIGARRVSHIFPFEPANFVIAKLGGSLPAF